MSNEIEIDVMSYDVVIVGAGPSGISAAIKLKQLALQNNQQISICIVEKGSEVGSHIISGAILDPISLNELIPDWKQKIAPISCVVSSQKFVYLTKKNLINLPIPPSLDNKGNYIISLGLLCKYLAQEAENLGVEIYTEFAAQDLILKNGGVQGIVIGGKGIDKKGQKLPNFTSGINLLAKQIVIAEGCRGSLAKKLINKFHLDKDSQPQIYSIGIKEIWEVDSTYYKLGSVLHSIGWPLDCKTYGGSFLYQFPDNKISVGLIVGLDYTNPYLSVFEEFQKFKTHPKIKPFFKSGRRISYGARAICEGGIQSLPKITFPGGVLIGDSAGFLNAARTKGIHSAIKSGILAAQAIFPKILNFKHDNKDYIEAFEYTKLFKRSWLYAELYKVRNIRPCFKWPLPIAIAYASVEEYVLKGKSFWSLKHKGYDHLQLKNVNRSKKINYSQPDGEITFDRLSSIFLSNIHYPENQPNNLKLLNPKLAIDVNFNQYGSPETKYCPAGVYEIIEKEHKRVLYINASNCIHCKTCDIKDPLQNIDWVCPEGGSGPNYVAM